MIRFLQLSLVGMVLSLSALGQEWRPSITHDKDVTFLGIVSNTRFVSASNDGQVIVWNPENSEIIYHGIASHKVIRIYCPEESEGKVIWGG